MHPQQRKAVEMFGNKSFCVPRQNTLISYLSQIPSLIMPNRKDCIKSMLPFNGRKLYQRNWTKIIRKCKRKDYYRPCTCKIGHVEYRAIYKKVKFWQTATAIMRNIVNWECVLGEHTLYKRLMKWANQTINCKTFTWVCGL